MPTATVSRQRIAHRVRLLRTARGWDQISLAHAANLDPAYVSAIESADPVDLTDTAKLAQALGVPYSDLLDPTGAWVERVLVGGDKKDPPVVGETVLGPVPMVYIPIHDQHPFQPVPFAEAAGGDGDVVEEAESHRPISFGVVPRRTHQGEAIVSLAGHDRVDQREETSTGQERGLVRMRRHGCVGVKGLRSTTCGVRHTLQVLLVVHQRNFLVGRRPRFQADQTGITEVFHKVTESGDPLRTLRMPVPGVVVFVTLIDHNRGSKHGEPPEGPLLELGRAEPLSVGVPGPSLHNQNQHGFPLDIAPM